MICTRQATDRDLESSNTIKRVNAWICAPRTTDHDPASVILDNKRKSVISVIFTGPNVFRNIFSVSNCLREFV